MGRIAKETTPLTDSESRLIAALADDYRMALTRWFAKRCKDQNEIPDLVQEVFLRLAKRANVADIEKVQIYVFQTAASVLNDWLRRRKVRHSDQHDEYSDTDGQARPGMDFTPERVLIGKERLNEVAVILSELPERTRTVFVLRRIEGMKYKMIAKRLGISVSATERHMYKALQHLKHRIGNT